MSNPDLATVTVNKLALFLVVVTGDKVSLEPTNDTVAPVVSYKVPLTCIVTLPLTVGSTTPLVTSEPPSIVKAEIVGGLSIAFQSVPV